MNSFTIFDACKNKVETLARDEAREVQLDWLISSCLSDQLSYLLLQLLTLILALRQLLEKSSFVVRLRLNVFGCAEEHSFELVKTLGKFIAFLLAQHEAHEKTLSFLSLDLGSSDLYLKIFELVTGILRQNLGLGELGVLCSELGYLCVHLVFRKLVEWIALGIHQSGL